MKSQQHITKNVFDEPSLPTDKKEFVQEQQPQPSHSQPNNKNLHKLLEYQYNDWHWQLRNKIKSIDVVSKFINLTTEEQRGLIYSKFKFGITPYLLSIIEKDNPDCPIRKQFIPTISEIKSTQEELLDPCGEDDDTVAPGIVHRYPDRVLLMLTTQCASYCRFCTRRRLVGQQEHIISQGEFFLALEYIKNHPEIRDVILSGGDPLILSDEKLEFFLKHLRQIKHIEILRISTRIPVALPQRITPKLCSTLKKFNPIFINIHINHPKELTLQTQIACNMLADNGFPLGSQTVLLKGINDKPQILLKLFHEILKLRIRPYYLYQCDIAQGTSHFRTPVSVGLKIIENLQGHTSGLAVPTFVLDTPGGGGKVPISPNYVISKSRNSIIVKNYEQKVYVYPEIK
jgi:lysine 2,3-aminomutase